MPDFINRIRKEIVMSKDRYDYPVEDWLELSRSDALDLQQISRKYILIVSDVARGMNQQEIDGYDAANPVPVIKDKMVLLNEMWDVCVPLEGDSQEVIDVKLARKMRFLGAINKYGSFHIMLEDFSYTSARQVMQMALAYGDITQDDYDIIDGILPTGGN